MTIPWAKTTAHCCWNPLVKNTISSFPVTVHFYGCFARNVQLTHAKFLLSSSSFYSIIRKINLHLLWFSLSRKRILDLPSFIKMGNWYMPRRNKPISLLFINYFCFRRKGFILTTTLHIAVLGFPQCYTLQFLVFPSYVYYRGKETTYMLVVNDNCESCLRETSDDGITPRGNWKARTVCADADKVWNAVHVITFQNLSLVERFISIGRTAMQ